MGTSTHAGGPNAVRFGHQLSASAPMLEITTETRCELPAVENGTRLIAWGLLLQVLGVAGPVAIVWEQARKDTGEATVTRYAFGLAWHQELHSGTSIIALVLGAAMLIAGSILVARPFVRHRRTLLIAVPLAAIGGLAAFGVLALVASGVLLLVSWLTEPQLELLGRRSIRRLVGRRRRGDGDGPPGAGPI